MDATQLLQQVQPTWSLAEKDQLQQKLEAYINDLIHHNFSALVQLLYRVDVSEQKLKNLLQQESGQEAARLIASLLIERQWEKALQKKNTPPPPADSEERW